MARLSLYLPPAAGDYSGAASVLFGLDCLVVLVDAGCCTRNYTEYDEPRWARRRKTTFSAQLRTLEATLGDESRLIEQTADMARQLGVSCVALLGTPVPAVTGMDLAGIACEVEEATGLPTLGVETSGFETYEQGASRALAALLGRFAREGAREGAGRDATEALAETPACDSAVGAEMPRGAQHGPHINILGLGPQDFQCEEDMAACIGWFEGAGAQIDFVTASEYITADVARAGSADASVVVAWSGLAAAQLLEERFGIPYVIGRPWCADDAHAILDQVKCALATDCRFVGTDCTAGAAKPDVHASTNRREAGACAQAIAVGTAPDPCASVTRVNETTEATAAAQDLPTLPDPILLIGEQVAMNSLRTHINDIHARANHPSPAITVATRFGAEASLAQPGDLSQVGEAELIAWAGAHPGFAWVGDPLFACLPGFADSALATLPHEATSSTLHAAQARTLAGDAALKAVESAIMERIGTTAHAPSSSARPTVPSAQR